MSAATRALMSSPVRWFKSRSRAESDGSARSHGRSTIGPAAGDAGFEELLPCGAIVPIKYDLQIQSMCCERMEEKPLCGEVADGKVRFRDRERGRYSWLEHQIS